MNFAGRANDPVDPVREPTGPNVPDETGRDGQSIGQSAGPVASVTVTVCC